MGHPNIVFFLFLLVHKISGGETSKGEDEPQSGASQIHVAAGTTTTGKNKQKKTLSAFVDIEKILCSTNLSCLTSQVPTTMLFCEEIKNTDLLREHGIKYKNSDDI